MRALPLLLVCAACAAAPAQVRGIDGQPLPTSARLDSDVAPVEITCGETRYLIVAEPRPYLAGTHLATVRPYVHDAPALCARIHAVGD